MTENTTKKIAVGARKGGGGAPRPRRPGKRL